MYIPLYNKSNYNLLSSLLKIDDIVKFAEDNNLTSISLTDSNMFGTMEFIKKCEKVNIKPVIGLEINLVDFKIVLFCKNYKGYQSLIRLSTIQSERKVTLDDLNKYRDEVICVVPFKYINYFENIKDIYSDLYVGYKNKRYC